MREELDYVGNRYTLAISIYFPFYILATPIATVLSRKVGPRALLSGITLSFGLVVLGFGFTKSWKDQVGLRAVLGLFEGGYFPSAGFLVSMYVASSRNLPSPLQLGEASMDWTMYPLYIRVRKPPASLT
jgi:MFS family permease